MRFSHRIQYCSLIAFTWLLCRLPYRWALGVGSAIGRLGWALGVRKRLVLENLARAMPDASQPERRRVAALAARNFGRTITEFIRLGIKDRHRIPELVKIRGLEPLRQALADGKGAILLTGHQGSWAIYFAAIAFEGIPLSLLVGKQHNQKVDAFIHRIPGDRVEFISKGRLAIKKILSKLNEGRAVVMVADQHAGKAGIMVPFLGEETPTLALPGSFAVKYDVPVFVMHGFREENDRHQVEIFPLRPSGPSESKDPKTEIVRRYNEEMGAIVKTRPEQYFWYHRRWRPEDKPATEDS
ncbi:hypothetical protein [Pelagicoccus sp. SDUM812003]|uniref:lysophospholipid acyltransferase family protein n=1 Tax=Pelagicoccus sp. SDUM812003 TaxID=3041267 RepID=UPI00280C8653|nr:hypothetical protein [Pelagicoccus sp. SDUM812003]MDQ8205146.1 hypothetical protein [Pelagicoccus sp. SDUM812003]